jgi:glycosyltransferase involved in cell wall biosynthesis
VSARRVAFAIDGALDQPTGGYLYDRIVVAGLRARGVSVDVVSLEHGNLARDLRANVRLFEVCRGDYDLVIVDELSHPRALLASLLPVKAPIVALVHHLGASERRGLASAMKLAIERPLLAAAERVVVTSRTTRSVLIAAGVAPERVHVALPGCDRLGTRAAPPPPADRTRLLFLGSISPRKGALETIEAFAAVADRATLTMAGPRDRDPVYARRVELAAAAFPSIRFTGTLDDDGARRALGEHDVLVLPSHYEGYGIAIAEAIANGLAIVSTDAGAIPEVTRDGFEARLIRPGDVAALTDALRAITLDSSLRSRMQLQAIERARTLARWSDTQRDFADALWI